MCEESNHRNNHQSDRNRKRWDEGQGFTEPKPCKICERTDGQHVVWMHEQAKTPTTATLHTDLVTSPS